MWRCALFVLGACGFQITTGGTPSDDQPPGDAIDAEIDTPPAPWVPGYGFRRRIDVTTEQNITFADFVVAISLPSDTGLADHAADDGQDLIVADADAQILDYELERFDGTTGALILWARVPLLPPESTLYLYYGGAARSHDPAATWAEATFRAVWHFGDALASQAADSAADHDVAAPSAGNAPADGTGIAGPGRTFDGTNDHLRDDGDDNTLDFGTQSFSWSLWVNVTTSAGLYDMPFYKGGSSAGQAGFDVELGTSNWTTYIGDGAKNRGVTYCNETLNRWVNLTGVADRQDQKLRAYVDGVFTAESDISDINSVATSSTFVMGSNSTNYWFRGKLDEVRLYPRALTPAWIAAEHANLRTPDTFAAVRAEEVAP